MKEVEGSNFKKIIACGILLVIVFDKTVDPIACIRRRLAHFYKHESTCTPCREGTGWLKQILVLISMEVG